MAHFLECGLQPLDADFCSCGCDPTTWCGNPECWTKHFGYPECKQEKLSANYRAETIRAARKSIAIPDLR